MSQEHTLFPEFGATAPNLDQNLQLEETVPSTDTQAAPKHESKEAEKPEEQHQEEVYDDDRYAPDEPIFAGGPLGREINEWKEKYGDLYFTPFDDGPYIWRKLARPEYRKFINDKTLDTLDREELITHAILLYPALTLEQIKNDAAGRASILSEQGMAKSAFVANSAPIKL